MKHHLCVILFLALVTSIGGSLADAQAPDLIPPRVAFSNPISPISVNLIYGPVHDGEQFGLKMSSDNFTTFTSPALASQAVLSGQADILNASFLSTLLLRQSGQDFKVFCPTAGKVDYVLIGRNGIKTMEQVIDPKTRIAVDGPGGAGTAILNALLQAYHLNVSVADLKNTHEMDTPQLRQTAWINNDVDVTMVRLSQFRQSEKSVPDGVIIAKLYEDVPNYMFTAYVASAQWLNDNLDVAGAFCASVLKGGHELSSSFDLYVASVKEFMSSPPDQSALQETFDLIGKYDFWQLQSGVTPEAVNFMASVAVNSGSLRQLPVYTDIYDNRAYLMALKLMPDYAATPAATMSVTQSAEATAN